jgi:hypothetical protein
MLKAVNCGQETSGLNCVYMAAAAFSDGAIAIRVKPIDHTLQQLISEICSLL